MRTTIYVDGRIGDAEDARVAVLDHGFLFGDSVYEVMWWHRGALIQADEHLDRLEASARHLYMDLQRDRIALLAAVRETCSAAGAGADDDAYVRLIVTRGAGPLGLDFSRVERRSLVIIVARADRPGPEAFERGLRAAVVGRRRTSSRALDPGAKTGNYLNNVLALHEARAAGADDGLMLNDRGELTEATTSNVYVVRGGTIVTPPSEAGILKGTTRARILLLCAREGVPAREATLVPDDLRDAEEVFLSSSVRGILPVVAVDGRPIGSGRPGARTRQVRALFEAEADREAERVRAGS